MSESLNLRVSTELKQRVQAYGRSLGLSDNAASIALLDIALRHLEAERRGAPPVTSEAEPAGSPT